ncbi:uncharacterized protein B0I36DRAFT_358991 [Microdochium trichocladiopsis]|uniref:BZIP domain-containing protein n=1 Tax=Microdochium trichocladiopsis TaxID=1682393 RepID=A0A9P8YFY1_9PEZI|nr:uncharacterized protein B0I36DRAFT_358991 [Microdochium trichocladiopsis]KAH7037269.1 hypothetical protein B0I36DRAFT_358991 [Microdochium trichocladiopsis]
MPRPPIADLPVDWPPPATPLDLAHTPLDPGLVTPMDDLDPQAQQHHDHHGGYAWGAWFEADNDHDLNTMPSHSQHLSYTESPFVSNNPTQHPPPYFTQPIDNSVQYSMLQSPSADPAYSPGTIDPSSTTNMSTSTDTSTESLIGRRPRTQRERNRLAAHKCRQKSKLNAEELQKQERELAEQHRCLTQHVQFLRNEVLDLKNEILRHGTCNCELIGEYIARAAQSLP